MPKACPSIPPRQVAAVVVGNALEFYDFLTYAFFAVYIGKAFFPSHTASTSLLASLATFGVGFVTRPIGGLIIGTMGDRLGRKPAMIFSFTLMGVAIIGLALTPPRAKIGFAAPALVIVFRLLQGFALGGEVGPSTAFLLEAAPEERRGFYTAFQAWTQHGSVLLSGFVGLSLAAALSEQQMQDFGWRIAFLLGAAIVPFGLLVRRGLPETFYGGAADKSRRVSRRPYLPVAALGVILIGSATIGTYVATYLTTYAIATLHMRPNIAFAATIVVGVCGLSLDLLSGALSDRIGRKPVMVVSTALLAVAILPAFYAIARYRTAVSLLVATAVLSSLLAIASCPIVTWLTESLPQTIRSGGLSVVYAVSIATFGGTTQFIVAWLTKVTRSPLAPAWYWTGAALIGLAAMTITKESRPTRVAELEISPVSSV